MKKLGKKSLIIMALVLISLIGVSYAFFDYYMEGDTSHKLVAGDIYLDYVDETDSISLTNIYPETAVEARSRNDNIITFQVSGQNTSLNKALYYQIQVNEGNAIEGKTRFKAQDIVFDLVEVNKDGSETLLVDAMSYSKIYNTTIWTSTVNARSSIDRTYKLRFWLSEDVLISDTEANADYTTSVFENSYVSIKVTVYGDMTSQDLPVIGYVTYNLSSVGGTNLEQTPIYADKSGILSTEVPTTPYTFLGWSTTQGGEVKYNPGDVIDANDVNGSNLTLYPALEWPTLQSAIETNTATYLQAADEEGNRYLKGSNPNNYVWYSGKLWRIVAINSDGTIKLVTQGNMTSIAWSIESETVDGTTTYNTVYENSQIHNWLKNEFLPTLEPSVLADSTWDYTTYASATATKAEPTAFVENEKVGLLTIYDYYKVRNGSNSNFLNNGYHWWTMTPKTDGSSVWYVLYNGSASNSSPTYVYTYGVRLSVNLKSDIQIMGGSGTKSNPYVIEGDKDTGVTSELLSNRISGEYINFNDTLYRIVGFEEFDGGQLTKVTMADYSKNSNTIGESVFGSDTFYAAKERIYSPTYGIGLYLEEWYQADSTSETYETTYIKNNYKAMIATSGENGDGVVWYTGPTSGIGYDYTLSKTGTPVSATIGLGYYGEMFSSQFGDGEGSSINTWLMTIASSNSVKEVASLGFSYTKQIHYSHGVRPSFYLKSNVKITGGNGQPGNPYTLTQ